MENFKSQMGRALEEARKAAAKGEVPVGAIAVDPHGKVVATDHNRTRELRDPTAHAEILALRTACANVGSERLPGYALYVTLEPCAMCAAAISHARISRLFFGATDAKSGGVLHGARIFNHPQTHHVPEIYDGIAAEESETLLRQFFERLR